MTPLSAAGCYVYLGRKLVFAKAAVSLGYQAEYDNITAHEEDLTPSITRIASERCEVAVNGRPYARVTAGTKKKHRHSSMRMIKRNGGVALYLCKKYTKILE